VHSRKWKVEMVSHHLDIALFAAHSCELFFTAHFESDKLILQVKMGSFR
jgi:hypothetical protein